MASPQRRQQLVHALAGERADLEHRRRRRGSAAGRSTWSPHVGALLGVEQLPLVEQHDDRAAGGVDPLGQALVLVGDALGGVDHEQRDVGLVDRPAGPAPASSTRCPRRSWPCGACRRCRRSGSGPSSVSTTVSMVSRVVPGMSCTTARSSPMSRLNSVDLPTLGRPTMATANTLGRRPSSVALVDLGSSSSGGKPATSSSSRSPVPRPCRALDRARVAEAEAHEAPRRRPRGCRRRPCWPRRSTGVAGPRSSVGDLRVLLGDADGRRRPRRARRRRRPWPARSARLTFSSSASPPGQPAAGVDQR